MLLALSITSLLLGAQAFASPILDEREPILEDRAVARTCKEVRFTVSGNAVNLQTNKVIVSNPTNLTQAVNNCSTSATQAVSGTQTFAGYFCDPNNKNANSTKLQVFRGSFFTNRESWTALGGTPLFNPPLAPYQPDMYSWFDYANALGYPTLAIDNLGDGASSKPDGLVYAQIFYDISLYHNLVTQIKAGTTGQLPSAYTYLIHVGNSLGSTLGNAMAANYPDDFNLFVLTGFSKSVQPSLPGVSLNMPAPAVLVNPTRFAGVPLDYVTSTSETALTNSFFGNPSFVDFDPQVAHLFFTRRDVVSLGYTITTYLASPEIATTYKGRVLVLTGEQDEAYCGLGSAALEPNPSCGPLLQGTGTLFPASDYNWHSVPRTGHATILHKSAQSVFKTAHQFMAGAKFAG